MRTLTALPKIDSFDGMKRRTLIAVLVALFVGISAGWAGRGFVAIDRCLDRGGAWHADVDACNMPIGNGS